MQTDAEAPTVYCHKVFSALSYYRKSHNPEQNEQKQD